MTQQQKIFIITPQGPKPVQLYRVYNYETIETPEPIEYVETGTPGSTTKITKLQKLFHIHPYPSRPIPKQQYLTINKKTDGTWPTLRLSPNTHIDSTVEWERSIEENQFFDAIKETKETSELKEGKESPELILRQFIVIADDVDVNIPDHKIDGNTLIIWNNQSTIYKCYNYDIYGRHLINEFRVAYTEPILITNSAFGNTETQIMLTRTVTPNDFIELSVPKLSTATTYTWYERISLLQSFTPIASKSSNTITIKDVSAREGYSYYCEIDDNGFKYKSDVVTLHYLATKLTKTQSDSGTDRVDISFDDSSPTTDLVFTCQIPSSTTSGASWYYKEDKNHSSSKELPPEYPNLKTNLLNRYQYVITNEKNNRWTFIENCNLIPATITEQPSNVSVNEGAEVTFTVTAEFATKYQWQYQWPEWRDADTWVNCGSSTFVGSTTTTNTLKFQKEKVDLSRNGYRVRCKITGTGGTIIYTEPAELIVIKAPPLILVEAPDEITTINIKDENNQEGSTQISVKVEGGVESYTYQWQYVTNETDKNNNSKWKNSTLTGYDTATFTVSANNGQRNNYYYRCKITDSINQTIYSEPTKIQIIKAVKITAQPQDMTGEINSTVNFALKAQNVSDYRWYYQNTTSDKWFETSMTGYNTNTLTIAVTKARNGYHYRCKLTGYDGEIKYSESALLTVQQKTETE